MVGSVSNGVQSASISAYQKRAEQPKQDDARKTDNEKTEAVFDVKEKDKKAQVQAANDSSSSGEDRQSSSRRGGLVDVVV